AARAYLRSRPNGLPRTGTPTCVACRTRNGFRSYGGPFLDGAAWFGHDISPPAASSKRARAWRGSLSFDRVPQSLQVLGHAPNPLTRARDHGRPSSCRTRRTGAVPGGSARAP